MHKVLFFLYKCIKYFNLHKCTQNYKLQMHMPLWLLNMGPKWETMENGNRQYGKAQITVLSYSNWISGTQLININNWVWKEIRVLKTYINTYTSPKVTDRLPKLAWLLATNCSGG